MYEKLKRDGDWLRVFRHDSSGGDFFASQNEARFTDVVTEEKFSVLRELEQFRRRDGKFQFRLSYPNEGIEQIWKQSNHFASSNANQFLNNGLLAGGEKVVEMSNPSGTADWTVIKKNNPGSTDYVFEYANIPTSQTYYAISIPQTRLRVKTEYTMVVWVGADDPTDIDKIGMFHARRWDGNGIGDVTDTGTTQSGSIYQTPGNEVVIDGVTWQRRYQTFTTPNTMNTDSMKWYLGHRSSNTINGNIYFANIQMINTNLTANYMGDYQAQVGGVRGYEAIDVDTTSNLWGGIEFNTDTADSLGDGSVDSTNSWYAIGAQQDAGSNTFQGPGVNTNLVELWVYNPISTRVGDMTLDTTHFNESGSVENKILSTPASTGSDSATLTINDEELIDGEAAEDGLMHLAIMDGSLNVRLNNTYVLSNSVERQNFINALGTITASELYSITSNGKVFSNAALDAELAALGAGDWLGETYYTQYDYLYSAIGRGDLGIVSDRSTFNDPLDIPYSAIGVAFDSFDDVGNNGYGNSVYELDGNSGPANPGSVPFTDYDPGQYVIYEVMARKSVDDGVAGTTRRATLYFRDASMVDLGVAETDLEITSVGVYEKITIYIEIPVGTAHLELQSDADVKMFTVHKATLSSPTGNVRMSANGMCGQKYSQTFVGGSMYNNVSFDRFARSNSNLISSLPFEQDQVQNVRWGDQVLSSSTSRVYTNTTTDITKHSGKTAFNPDIPHVVGVWVHPTQKASGTLTIGLKAQDGTDTDIDVIELGTGTLVSDYKFQELDISVEPVVGEYVLMFGFVLPSDWTLQECQDFSNQHKGFFGYVADDPSLPLDPGKNGLGSRDFGTGDAQACQLQANTSTIQMVISDESNTTAADTMWAYPFIAEITSAAWDANDVYSPSIGSV